MNLKKTIESARKLANAEGGMWCVVDRRDPYGGLFEYAIAPCSVTLDGNESIVWAMYQCSINDYSAVIEATSPSEAARKCVEKRIREFSWFANQSPELATVNVDGVEYEPASVSDSENTWDFLG